MISIKRPLLALGAAALMTVSLTACGGASGAPKDASVSDFCAAMSSQDAAGQKLGDKDYDKAADLLHKLADELKKTGTPKGISDEERKGFEVEVDKLGGVSSGDLKKADEDDNAELFKVSGDDKKAADAFDSYFAKTCSQQG